MEKRETKVNCEHCERELPDTPTAYLCQGCTSKVAGWLAGLPAAYDELAAHLVPGVKASGPSGRTKAPHAPLPVAEDVLTLRAGGGLVAVLEDWRAALHHDLGWEPPVLSGGFPQRVRKAVDGLTVNLPWIASSWPEAGQFATEIRQLHGQVQSIIAPQPKTLRVGVCTAPSEDGTECGAVLRWTQGETEIRCRWCSTEYPPSAWVDLAAGAA